MLGVPSLLLLAPCCCWLPCCFWCPIVFLVPDCARRPVPAFTGTLLLLASLLFLSLPAGQLLLLASLLLLVPCSVWCPCCWWLAPLIFDSGLKITDTKRHFVSISRNRMSSFFLYSESVLYFETDGFRTKKPSVSPFSVFGIII